MRASVVLVAFLAGCTVPADPLDGVDPTVPLYGQAGIELHGPHVEDNPDVLILAADCRAGRTLAYTFNATGLAPGSGNSAFLETRLELPNATSFALATFRDSGSGLEPAWIEQGGSAMASLQVDIFNGPTYDADLPEAFTVPLQNGIGRVIIACHGDGPVNYVLGDDARIDAPHYVRPTELDGFDSFAAFGEGTIGAIYIPPTGAPTFPVVWATAGGAQVRYTEASPVSGVRIGVTEIRWSGGPGWTTVSCAANGLHEVGEWSYVADLHGTPREVGGPMVDTIATLGLSQFLLSGYVEAMHTEEGNDAGSFVFTLEHEASQGISWQAECSGLHFGATLEQAFGTPGQLVWDPNTGALP